MFFSTKLTVTSRHNGAHHYVSTRDSLCFYKVLLNMMQTAVCIPDTAIKLIVSLTAEQLNGKVEYLKF